MRADTYRTGARMGLTLFALLLWLAPAAFAGPPVHPPLPDPIGAYPLNHACGTAVDSEGDIYVSNSGEAKVEVFDPAGTHLTSIPNANGPCALAVDSKGNLYVSETSTGKVLRYTPNAYPFSGTPSYGAPVTIDGSGNAKGIAVDPKDDSLYVAEGNRVAMFNSEGTPGIDEEQRISVRDEGGTFRLKFEGGSPCAPIPTSATEAQMEACLTEILGAGNFSVREGAPFNEGLRNGYFFTFKGALGGKDTPLIEADTSGMLGVNKEVLISQIIQGFDGHIGEGELTGATGIAAYTYDSSQHYLSVAEPSEDKIQVLYGTDVRALEPRYSIDGSETSGGELGLAAGSYLGLDPSNGHLFAYDATHKALNEFEATGRYFTRILNPGFADAGPTAIAVDRSGGANDGTLYASAGAAAGAKLLAFGPLAEPSRKALGPPRSRDFNGACGTAVDSQGDLYVAGTTEIKVYDPEGNPIEVTDSKGNKGKIVDAKRPCSLAVDSEGNLYAAELGSNPGSGEEKVVLYKPSAYPFSTASPPSYGAPQTIEAAAHTAVGLAVSPANDRLFVAINARDVHSGYGPIVEFASAKAGSALLNKNFCEAIGPSSNDVGVYGANGEVYVLRPKGVDVCDPTGTKVLQTIDGSGSPGGLFSTFEPNTHIAIDQSNGHVAIGRMHERGAVEEYEPSGAFVGRYGSFGPGADNSQIALDNSCALHRNGLGEPEPLSATTTPTCAQAYPANGNLYVDYLDPAPAAFDITALGPVDYGEPPSASLDTASEVSGTAATLNGAVNPNGFAVTDCHFEYLLAADYEENLKEAKPGFEGAEEAECVPDAAAIGQGKAPVAVKATLSGLQAEGRYRFRLLAANKYGPADQGDPGLFGPPIVMTKSAQPVRYREATLRANLDPSGLATQYRFEYGLTEAYGQSTPAKTLAADEGPSDVEATPTGLKEGTTYHFRFIAESEDAEVAGPDQEFTTFSPRPVLACPNATLRLEDNSTRLPDCRAYELVTPADTRGNLPQSEGVRSEGANFNDWLVTPSGPLAGDSLAFSLFTTLPGTDGNGLHDTFRASRDADGWASRLISPSYAQQGTGGSTSSSGIAADQRYAFFDFNTFGPTSPGVFPAGTYLRVPEGSPPPSPNCAVEVEPGGGFERLGCGSLGADPKAEGRYLSAGGEHVIFTGNVPLEPGAPPSPTTAIYDRRPGGPTHVVSLLPGDLTPSGSAAYQGATEDGSAMVFSLPGGLYLRRDNTETVKVAEAGAFAQVSEDGTRVFYESGGDLYVCDVQAGACTGGGEPPGLTKIASAAKFAVISADGSHAYYVHAGKLYVWSGAGTSLVAQLDPKDLSTGPQPQFPGTFGRALGIALDAWTAECAVRDHSGGQIGRAFCPLRVSSDGRFLVFQSHADLTPPYEGQGHSEVYRYDATEESLLCVSCDPSGAPAGAEADLQVLLPGSPVSAATLIPNLSEDGKEVFFQTKAALLPEDANSVNDVYEWQAQGAGGCTRPAGCLALISSGQGENPSYLYSMTPDGHDVFFSTTEKLVSADIAGSPSLYDARVEGGFPAEVQAEPCHGDACQGEGSAPPARPAVRSDVPSSGNFQAPPNLRCRKGERKVRRAGKARCAKAHRHKRRKRAKAKGRASR